MLKNFDINRYLKKKTDNNSVNHRFCLHSIFFHPLIITVNFPVSNINFLLSNDFFHLKIVPKGFIFGFFIFKGKKTITLKNCETGRKVTNQWKENKQMKG